MNDLKKEKKNLWYYSGIFILATGAVHSIVALVFNVNIYFDIIKDGYIGVIKNNYESMFAFWFLICGICIMLLGMILHTYIKHLQKPAPRYFGIILLILSIFGILGIPVSGFWLFIPQALIIILAKDSNEKSK